MHLVILSGAARPQARSNTAKIIEAFRQGYEETGNTTEVWYLSDRKQWTSAAAAFSACDNVLIALLLYVENVPGILLEFLAGLQPKTEPGTRLAFLVQGGFPEASQSRCCEAYVKTLPAQLGCSYGGTLIKGDMFGLGLTSEKNRRKMLAGFTEMGGITPKPTPLMRKPCGNLPGRSICPRSSSGCSGSLAAASSKCLWAASPKSWAAGTGWTRSPIRSG